MNMNEAIYIVLTTKYKKNAPEAFKMVESDPDLEVYKSDGQFTVKHKETHKYIYYHRCWPKDYIVLYNHSKNDLEKAKKIDFQNFLITKRDTSWRNIDESRSQKQRYYLRNIKWNITYHKNQIEEIREKISKLEKSLEWQIEQKVKAEIELAKYRIEIGLERR